MNFLPSTIFDCFTRRSVFHSNIRQLRRISRTAEVYTAFLTKQKVDDVSIEVRPEPPLSFESLGLGLPFIKVLQKAFPKVETPTDIQAQLIPAILGTQDVLLKDVTGSGKFVDFDFDSVLFPTALNQVVWIDTWAYQ